MKYVAIGVAACLALSMGTTYAAQNVANTTQKGSLLIFPLITVDPTNSSDTFVEITNDATSRVHVECTYVNERKGRTSFDFDLSGDATASWDVKTLDGDVAQPNNFPNYGPYYDNGTNVNRGALICFAVDQGSQNQIAFNNLTGHATVFSTANVGGQTDQAFRYNAWSFVARGADGQPAPNNTIQGTPGLLNLTGDNSGTSYDACPLYNITPFMPNGAKLGNVTTLDNTVSVAGCYQDLRQDFQLHLTKLRFAVWNSHEASLAESYQCVDSVRTVFLGNSNPYLLNPGNFNYSTVRTPDARFKVKGLASTQCPYSVDTGLLGVVSSSVAFGTDTTTDAETGSTTQGAGSFPGYVQWDPSGSVPFGKH